MSYTLNGQYSVAQIRNFAFERGYLDAAGNVIENRWRDIYVDAIANQVTSYELDAAFGLAPGTVADFLHRQGVAPLDQPQPSMPQSVSQPAQVVVPPITVPIQIVEAPVRPYNPGPIYTPPDTVSLPVDTQPISLPVVDDVEIPPLNPPLQQKSNPLLWLALGLGAVALLK